MNIGDFLPIFSFAAVIAGYGVWVGNIQNRLKKVEEQSAKAEDGENRIIKLEEKVDKLEDVVYNQIEQLKETINKLMIQTAVLAEKVDILGKEIRDAK